MKFVVLEQVLEQVEVIKNMLFWFDVNLLEFCSVMCIDGMVMQLCLKQVVLMVIFEVNVELYDFCNCQQMLGWWIFVEVFVEMLDGKSECIWYYYNVVFCWVCVVFNECYQDYDVMVLGVK